MAIDGNPPRTLQWGELAPYLDMANLPTRDMGRTWLLNDFSGLECASPMAIRWLRGLPASKTPRLAYVDFLQENQVDWGGRRNPSCCVLKHPVDIRTRILPCSERPRPAVSRYKA